jgi:lipopolysaccharide transport system ATP-binding protein
MTSPTLEATAPTSAHWLSKDEDVVLSVDRVSKQYKLWASPGERLRYSMLSQALRTLRAFLPPDSAPLVKLRQKRDSLHRDFVALEELSFDVRRGESLGIIGRNGAGKSTLLQIIAGTLRPSTGRVNVYGRLAALLELGSGFNMEYTGRENVYLNASLLGFSKKEVDAKFDSIAAFADIGRFLEQPVKTYSSGMMVRLAFSVQMAVEPAIFIIDEALAVGDIYFQNKCNKLLKRKLDDGMTLLLVSHSPAAVRTLCQRGLVLDRGRRAFLGPSDEAVNVYHALGAQNPSSSFSGSEGLAVSMDREKSVATDSAPPASGERGKPAASIRPTIPQGLGQIQDEIGDGEIVITGGILFNDTGKPCRDFTAGEPIHAGFSFRSRVDINDILVGFAIRDRFNNVITAQTSVNQGLEIASLKKNRLYTVYLTLAGRLGAGEYLMDFGLGSHPNEAGSPTSYYHRIGGIAAFSIGWHGETVTFQGFCDVGAEFSGVELAESALPSAR